MENSHEDHDGQGSIPCGSSNVLTLEILRAALHEMPIDERPPITWIVYGKEVFFDKDLKSHDAF